MSQRLNDVTGEPIQLSARQHEAQREELVTVVNHCRDEQRRVSRAAP